jgi:hypothetical protein
VGTDAEGIEPDSQLLCKAAAAGDSSFLLEIAKDQTTLAGGKPTEASLETGEAQVDLGFRREMAEGGEGIDRLVVASGLAVPLQGHPVGYGHEVA